MGKQRDPLRDEAKRLYENAGGAVTNRQIAQQLGVDERKVAVWKQRDRWNVVQRESVVQQKEQHKKLVASVAANPQVTEQQRAFCLHYTRSFNATRAHMAAFGTSYASAHSHGYAQLRRPEVQAEIRRLRDLRNEMILADAQDLVWLHMRIAFADITDYLDFSGYTVRLHDSHEVDGQLLAEVKEGKEGITIKLVDKQRSLAFLERYFEANPMDRHKKAYDDARLELERRRQNAQEAPEKVVPIIDDI